MFGGQAHVGMWRPEVGIACLPLLLSSHWFICFQTRSLVGLKLVGLARLVGRTQGSSGHYLASTRMTGTHCHTGFSVLGEQTKVLMFAWQASF